MKHLLRLLARSAVAPVALLLALLAGGGAQAESVFYIDNQAAGATGIYTVDVATGGPSTRVVALSGNQYNATLATRPSDGVLFWLDADAPTPPNLWRWDPATPATPPQLLGSPGPLAGVVRLGFDSFGRLLAMDRPSSSLWILSVTNGSIVGTVPLSGTIPATGGGDLCLDPTNNTLYLTLGQQLYTVSTFGEISLIGNITGLIGADVTTGCAVTVGGSLLVSQNNQAVLSRLNPVTAVATQLIQSTGNSLIGDLSSSATGLIADLAVTKVALNPTPGATAAFTVTVTNNGPGRATDVRVLDAVPAGLTFVSATASQGAYSAVATTVGVNAYPAGTWRIGTLAAGQSVTLTLNYAVTVGTLVTNTAAISYNDMYDPVSSNNQASASITPSVDLQVTKVGASAFGRNSAASYTLSVRNTGLVATSGTITVTDVLPAGMSFVSGTGTGWTCGAAGQTVTCTSSTAIAAATVGVPVQLGNPITLNVNLDNTVAIPTVANTVSVAGGSEPASNNGNNTGSVTVPVCAAPCTDLTPVKTIGASPMLVGSVSTYTLTVNNSGAVASAGTITVTDTLPTGLTLNSVPAGTGWTCTAAAPINTVNGTGVSCTRALAIAGNASAPPITFNVNVAATAYPLVTNSVSVSGGGDSFAGNNTTSLITPVTAADLSISKVANTAFQTGSVGTYLITVSNVGNGASAGTTTVNDTLPANLTLNAALSGASVTTLTGGGLTWTCTGAAGATSFSCNTTGSLAVGSSYRITVPVAVAAAVSTTPTLVNTATVTNPNEPASLNGNNSSTATDQGDLVVAKSHTDPFRTSATNATWVLTVSNIGTVAVAGTTAVTDTLPAGFTLAAPLPAGTGWTCTGAGAINTLGGTGVSCTRATTLNPADSFPPITVTVNTPATATSVTNTANVTNTVEPAAKTGNNSASDPTNVLAGPTWTKAFAPASVAVGATSTLTFTITKPVGLATLSGITFIDPLPANIRVVGTPATTNSCGGTLSAASGDALIALTAGSFSGATCTITVPVNSSTSTAGALNTTGVLSTSNAGNAAPATATLVVTAPVGNPAMTKATSPNPIAAGATSTLTFTIANKASNTNDVGFTDLFPLGVTSPTGVVTFSGTCGNTTGIARSGTYLATPPGPRIVVAGVDLAASATCTISIPVTAAAAGSYSNTTAGNISGLANLTSSVNDTLVVLQANLTKTFSPAAVQPSAPSTLTFTIANAGGNPAFSGMGFVETLPGSVTLASVPTTPQCNGTVAGVVGGTTITVSNAALAPNQPNCTITAQVNSATTGLFLNNTARVGGVTANLVNNVNATLAVFTPPVLSKTVATLNDPVNGTTTPKAIPGAEVEYTVTINNASNTALDANSVIITDSVPANTSLFIGGTGPVTSFSVPGLTVGAGDISYSNSGGPPYTFGYTPTGPYDATVTAFKVVPQGTMPAASSGTLKFKVQVR